jgi:hypothetical protein
MGGVPKTPPKKRDTMHVQFIQNYIPYEVGEVVWLEEDVARELEGRGIVKILDEPKSKPEPVKTKAKRKSK